MKTLQTLCLLAGLSLLTSMTLAAPKYPAAVLSDDIEVKKITIWSDGRALDGDIYRPKNLSPDTRLPAIVTSHGWGGDKMTAARYAAKFAEAGFIALTFTHSTWGNSQGNVVLQEQPSARDNDKKHQLNKVVRKLIDPIDWTQNFRSAVDYIEGEDNVNGSRIGAWGTSFGGGIATLNAAYDDRIKSLVTQVGAFPTLSGKQLEHAKQRAIDIARGEIEPIPENLDMTPGLDGTPHLARFIQYRPMDAVELLQIPMLLIAAGEEDLFKNEDHSGKAFNLLKSKGLIKTEYYEIADINHYGIYFDGYEKGSDLALEWFKKTLQ